MGTGKEANDAALRGELAALGARIAPRFARPEVRERAGKYLAGLLDPDGRRTGWGMAERVGEERPDGAQRLLDAASWDVGGVRDDLREYVLERLGDPSGVLVLAETGFRKKGRRSAGVARQRNPTTGRDENCQVGIFLAYASARGWAFVDFALYLPEEWAGDLARRREAGVPDEAVFSTKSELAGEMLERAYQGGLQAAGVVGDELYGKDRGLRQWLEARRWPYVLAVERPERLLSVVDGLDTRGWPDVLVSDPSAWQRPEARGGDRLTHDREWAGGPLPFEITAGLPRWLLVSRSLSEPKDIVYYRAYAPDRDATLATLARSVGTCEKVEGGLELAKGEVGLDQYEVRLWDAWHRYVVLCLLAHTSLQMARTRAKTDNRDSRQAAGAS